jgi:hypothetical protein
MKRSAMQHTKLNRLMRQLSCPKFSAVGILECLWHLTARETPNGDIGKLSDQDIADAIGWDGDAPQLVQALVDARWLDADDAVRLRVHDWEEHADDATKKAIARSATGRGSSKSARKCPDNGAARMDLSGNVQTIPDESGNVRNCHTLSSSVRTIPENYRLPKPEPEPEPKPLGILTCASDDARQPEIAEIPDEQQVQKMPIMPVMPRPPKPPKPTKPTKPRERNPLLDVLVGCDGSDPLQATGSAWGAAAKALSEIRAVCADVTPSEIERRAANWASHFDGASVSPNAIAKHWARLDKPRIRDGPKKTLTPKSDVDKVLDGELEL